MQYDVFPDNLAERTLFQEKYSKLIQFIERQIRRIRPVECELISAIGIIGEITSIYTIGNDKQLNIVEQPMKGCLVIALYLIVCLFEFYTPTFQFNLNQSEAALEAGLIATLRQMDYEYVQITEDDNLYANFKRQLEIHNKKQLAEVGRNSFTDEEFEKILIYLEGGTHQISLRCENDVLNLSYCYTMSCLLQH